MNAINIASHQIQRQEKIELLMTGCYPTVRTQQLVKLFKRSTFKVAAMALDRAAAFKGAQLAMARAQDVTARSFMHPVFPLLAKRCAAIALEHGTHAVDALVELALAPESAERCMLDCVHDMRLPGGGSLDWAQQSIRHQGEQLLADLGDDQGWVLGSRLAACATGHVQEAGQAIAEVWPEVGQQHDMLLARVVYFSAESFWSSSDPWTFGAVYVNPQPHWGLAHYAETLLHEVGHHALMMFETVTPLVTNGAERVSSPLRKDPRPISGVLHAAFVLIRMAEGLWRLAEARLDVDAATRLARTNRLRLLEGIEILERRAALTRHGIALVEEMRRACNDLAAKLA